jgi:hypothetical protein
MTALERCEDRVLEAERLIGRTVVDVQSFLVATDSSEMSNQAEAIERLGRLLPKLTKFMGEI